MIGFGQVCNSAYFDGIDDGLRLMHPMVSGSNYALSVGREFTVEFWIKTSGINGTIFQKGGFIQSGINPGYVNVLLDQNGFIVANYGHPSSSTNITFGGQGPELYSINAINDNNWHHITFLRDSINGSNYNVELYVDGVLNDNAQDTWQHPYVAVSQPTSWTNPLSNQTVGGMFFPFMLGQGYPNSSATSGMPLFNGYLDNVRFWNRDLSNSEIFHNMNTCIPNMNSLEFSFDFDSIINGEFADYTSVYDGEILDISIDTISPICCDCQISTPDTTICPGDIVTITTQSILNPLWDNGDTTSSLVVSTNTDTTITLYFLDNSGSVICSDDITITITQTTVPTIQQVGNNLMSSNGQSYQWYLNGVMLSGETGQLLSILGDGAYTVEVTDQNGCNTMSAIFNVSTSSVLDIENTNPNLIGIFDLFGRRLNEKTNNKILLMYFDDGTVEKRITIE